MPAAMSRIAEKGNEKNVKYVITFVARDNIPSLKGCHKSGFYPYIIRKETYFLFYKFVTFNTIPSAIKEEYEALVYS